MSDFEMTEEESDFDIFEDDDNEEEFIFEPVVADKSIRPVYLVDCKQLNTSDLQQIISQEMSHVSNILGCTLETAGTLLRYFKWNKEKLIESYMEDDQKTTKAAGVLFSEDEPKFMIVQGFSCDICCADEPDLQTLALSCNHRFCINCYEQYLTMKITEEGESRHVKCPAPDCKLVVDQKTVEMVVKPAVLEK
jgi:ariadne-1